MENVHLEIEVQYLINQAKYVVISNHKRTTVILAELLMDY